MKSATDFYFYLFWFIPLVFSVVVCLNPLISQLSCLDLHPKPSSPTMAPPNLDPKPSSPTMAPTNLDPKPPCPTIDIESNFVPNVIIFLLGVGAIFFGSKIVRKGVLYLGKLTETKTFVFKLLFGVLFHILFNLFEEESMYFLMFVGVAIIVIVLLKFVQDKDETGVTEELGNCFIKIGVEYVIKFHTQSIFICRLLFCLVPFALSTFAMFSKSVRIQFYESVERKAVKSEEEADYLREVVVQQLGNQPEERNEEVQGAMDQAEINEENLHAKESHEGVQGLRGYGDANREVEEKSKEGKEEDKNILTIEEEKEELDDSHLLWRNRKGVIEREEERVGEKKQVQNEEVKENKEMEDESKEKTEEHIEEVGEEEQKEILEENSRARKLIRLRRKKMEERKSRELIRKLILVMKRDEKVGEEKIEEEKLKKLRRRKREERRMTSFIRKLMLEMERDQEQEQLQEEEVKENQKMEDETPKVKKRKTLRRRMREEMKMRAFIKKLILAIERDQGELEVKEQEGL